MKANGFLIKANQYFGVETGRLIKLASGLRRHNLFPDTREKGPTAHVKPIHAAHAVRIMALSPNPFADDFDTRILECWKLSDERGRSFIDELAELLSNNGENLYISGLVRVSFSLDRPSVVLVYRDPVLHQEVVQAGISTLALRENDRVFGERPSLKAERFCIVKASALKEIAQMIGTNALTERDQVQRELISTHIRK
jgi:hypothetical protein